MESEAQGHIFDHSLSKVSYFSFFYSWSVVHIILIVAIYPKVMLAVVVCACSSIL
jgi:hypothetical protein